MRSITCGPVALAMLLLGCDAQPGTQRAHTLAQASSCLDVAASEDADVARNRAALATPGLCLRRSRFRENGLDWLLRVVESGRPGPLWVVLHDNETAAFDSGVYAVARYGGSLVAVETGGHRNNGPQDPNRNFGVGRDCPHAHAAAPVYSAAVLEHVANASAVIALHTNDRGYADDESGGSGHISILNPGRNNTAFRAAPFPGAASAADTLVILAGEGAGPAAEMPTIRALNARNINVVYEHVSATSTDCSLSNYAAINHISPYFNIEVAHGDGATQRRVIDIVVGLLSQGS